MWLCGVSHARHGVWLSTVLGPTGSAPSSPSLPVHPCQIRPHLNTGPSCWRSHHLVRNVLLNSSGRPAVEIQLPSTPINSPLQPCPSRVNKLPLPPCTPNLPNTHLRRPVSKPGGITLQQVRREGGRTGRLAKKVRRLFTFRAGALGCQIARESYIISYPQTEPVHTVFGKPLKESLQHASVQISTANSAGELYVWGYIPVVVAKWCVV